MSGVLGAWTPGPWRADYHDEDCVGAWWDVSTADGKQIICGLDHDEFTTEQDTEQIMANFALMAAAPDLLAAGRDLRVALRAWMNVYRDCGGAAALAQEYLDVWDAAEKKARGEG